MKRNRILETGRIKFLVVLLLSALIMAFLWRIGYLHILIVLLMILVTTFLGWRIAKFSLQTPPTSLEILANDPLYLRASYLSNMYRTTSIFWMSGYMCLQAIPIALTGVILYSATYAIEPRKTDFFCSLAILILTVLVYVISPDKQTKCYRRAYVYLYGAMLRYEGEATAEGITKEAQHRLEAAIIHGEEIISGTYYIENDAEDAL